MDLGRYLMWMGVQDRARPGPLRGLRSFAPGMGAVLLVAGLGGLLACSRGGTLARGAASSPSPAAGAWDFASPAAADPSISRIVLGHDGTRRADTWGRPEGWAAYRLDQPPDLGFGSVYDDPARLINAARPYFPGPVPPMSPFVLKASETDRAAALRCLAQAVYYEAGFEPEAGQAAVAQVVINRLRHPAWPKSVCGVVYQGSARETGCQFTFTCDGALAMAPEPARWAQALEVARRALGGAVQAEVGTATHYHADYVAPWWAPSLVKLTRIGAHIFYRWTGPAGQSRAFSGRYQGGETQIAPQILEGLDAPIGEMDPQAGRSAAALRSVVLTIDGESRSYQVAEGGDVAAPGALQPSRRRPTPEEVRRINESLARLEAQMDGREGSATATSGAEVPPPAGPPSARP